MWQSELTARTLRFKTVQDEVQLSISRSLPFIVVKEAFVQVKVSVI